MTRNNDKINIRQIFREVEETERWKGKYEVRVIIGKHSFSFLLQYYQDEVSRRHFKYHQHSWLQKV
jgi:hypothetical protein